MQHGPPSMSNPIAPVEGCDRWRAYRRGEVAESKTLANSEWSRANCASDDARAGSFVLRTDQPRGVSLQQMAVQSDRRVSALGRHQAHAIDHFHNTMFDAVLHGSPFMD